MSKIWLITGSSKGFGKIWAESALARGDKVAATTRNLEDLKSLEDEYGDDVLPIKLDVNDRAACFDAVRAAKDRFGKIDVLINNAGFGHFGAIEELTEEDARAQIETNVFGALWVTQAVLPIMREQKAGHIIQISSMAGLTSFGTVGIYNASKWALEGMSQALNDEVKDMGINVTLIEPGGFDTDWAGASAIRSEPIEAYAPVHQAVKEQFENMDFGDPSATGPVMMEIADMEKPPLRVIFGSGNVPAIREEYQKRLDEWGQYEKLSEAAHGKKVSPA